MSSFIKNTHTHTIHNTSVHAYPHKHIFSHTQTNTLKCTFVHIYEHTIPTHILLKHMQTFYNSYNKFSERKSPLNDGNGSICGVWLDINIEWNFIALSGWDGLGCSASLRCISDLFAKRVVLFNVSERLRIKNYC